jgi:hypothetical protein
MAPISQKSLVIFCNQAMNTRLMATPIVLTTKQQKKWQPLVPQFQPTHQKKKRFSLDKTVILGPNLSPKSNSYNPAQAQH